MIKFLKKHKYKLLTLMLSIVSIFTLFLSINKTYAYETNTFSYTIDTTNETFTTIDNKQGILLNTEHLFTLKNTTNSNQYLLLNFYAIDMNTNTIQTTTDNLGLSTIAFRDSTNNRIYGYYNQQRITTTASDYMFTFVYKPYNFSEDINAFYLEFYNVQYNYRFLIVNIDYVNYTDIGISQYYDTYYGQIEDNYNALLSDYNDLQNNYDTLEVQYGDLQDDYEELENNYNNLNSQVESLQSQITTLQNQKNTLEQQLEQIKEEYEYIINQTAPFNPSNIQSTSVVFNNTNIDIPYNSFVIFDYFQIELDLMDFDLLNGNDYRHLIQSVGNNLTITLNLEKPIVIDNLEYWCHMRDFYNDSLDLTLMYNSNLVTEFTLMNNEHQDSQGNMAPYYISSETQQINRLIFNFNLNDSFYNNYQGYIDYMVQSGTYTQGYNDGLYASNQYIDKLKNEIIEDEQYILSLEQTIKVLQNQINSFSSDYNLNNLMWTIASTPFESFKQIWNVYFFGVNISTMITGFITGLIVLWIIKKFFL